MTCTALPARTVRVRTRPAHLKIVRNGHTVAIAPRAPQRPAWPLLYAIVPLVCALMAVAELALSEGLARNAAELLAAGAGITLARLWLGCNRVALADQATARSQGEARSLSPHPVHEEATR